ncbi:MAG: HD domain-containing protein [Acidimicrobiia bacterium]|nr:HD domain-containing protein [Acidimicrobiia bacterium]
MSHSAVRSLLTALRGTASDYRLYGAEHKITAEAVNDLVESATRLVGTADRAMITIVEETVYLNRSPLAAVSIDFNGMILRLQEMGVESIVFEGPILKVDCAALAAFVAGIGKEPPTTGSVVLNEDSWARMELDDSPTEGLRQAYSASLGALRGIETAVRSGTRVELSYASSAVTSLLKQMVAQPEAALLLTTVKSHCEYTFYHSVNTSILALGLGRLVGLDKDDQFLLGLGALLHDIGKVGVAPSILQHPGRLAPAQWNEIKRHPVDGAEMIMSAATPDLELAAVVAFEHHAGFDGAGYPTIPRLSDLHGHGTAKSGADLHLFSRLAAVVDTYDAITTRRSYRRAESPGRALHALLRGAGRSHDPDAVQAFIGLMGVYPPGSRLLLNDGRIAVVIRSINGSDVGTNAAVITSADGTQLEVPETIRIDPGNIADQVAITAQDEEPTALLDLLIDSEAV